MCAHYFGAKSAFEIKKIIIAHRYAVVIMLPSTCISNIKYKIINSKYNHRVLMLSPLCNYSYNNT